MYSMVVPRCHAYRLVFHGDHVGLRRYQTFRGKPAPELCVVRFGEQLRARRVPG